MKKYKTIIINIEINDDIEDIKKFANKIENIIFIPVYSVFGDFIGFKPKA